MPQPIHDPVALAEIAKAAAEARALARKLRAEQASGGFADALQAAVDAPLDTNTRSPYDANACSES